MVEPTEPYQVRIVSDGLVEAWSQQRLQFEPKGWMKDFRSDLRTALRELSAGANQGLYTVYESSQMDTCDVENILIYNVGTSAFKNSSHRQLTFERRFTQPTTTTLGLKHYHRYEILPVGQTMRGWKRGRRLAQWRADVPPLSEATKLSTVWWALKQGGVRTDLQERTNATYIVELTLGAPGEIPLNLAKLVKVLFDACIVALQSHAEGPDVPELAKRVSHQVHADAHEVAAALCNPRVAVLYGDKILRQRGLTGVHWNPADDRCVVGKIRRDESQSEWSLAGELFEVSPRH